VTQVVISSSAKAVGAGGGYVSGLVSVVIPAFNGSAFIGQCLDSVFNQTYTPFEVIVVDDGSTDRTKEALAPWIQDGKIRYLYQNNRGTAAARNLGIQHASGEFLALVDQDDLWLPDKLERQVKLFRNERVGLVYTDTQQFGPGVTAPKVGAFPGSDRGVSSSSNPNRHRFSRGRVYRKLLGGNFIPSSSVMIRRSVLDRTGLFRERIGNTRIWYCDDYELWLRIAQISEIDFVEKVLMRYRIHPRQGSKNQIGACRQMCTLYRQLIFQKGAPGKLVMARNYVKQCLKWTILSLQARVLAN
jgi:glycosyltransferase involved in cell wall biosynthesis